MRQVVVEERKGGRITRQRSILVPEVEKPGYRGKGSKDSGVSPDHKRLIDDVFGK